MMILGNSGQSAPRRRSRIERAKGPRENSLARGVREHCALLR